MRSTRQANGGCSRIGFAALAVLAVMCASPVLATTRVDDGFTTAFTGDGDDARPANRVSGVRKGSDVYYWVEWNGHPSTRPALRCVIRDSPEGEPILDHTDVSDDAETEGFTVCGMETDDEDVQPGTYYFEQYIDGELVGKGSIGVAPRFAQTRRSLYKEIKFWVGVVIAALFGIGWLLRRMGRHGDGPLDPPLMPESAKSQKARESLAIGVRVGQGIVAGGSPIDPPKDNAGEIAKAAAQFRQLAGQPDKAKALEAGRRHLGLLVKDRKLEGALKAFKECVALDPAFRPERGEDAFAIAKAARSAGDPGSAVAALRGFDKAWPGHEQIPEVYVFSAKLMAEDLGNAEMARKILEHVVQKYPGHFVAQEAKKYLQGMPQPG